MTSDQAARKAAMSWGSATEHQRYLVKAPNRRRLCRCGCKGRITHYGMANGVALVGGCELTVRRWVRTAA